MLPPALSVRYASERGSFEDLSDYEIWETLMYLTLSPEKLWENSFPVETETGITVNYKPSVAYNHGFGSDEIEKCKTYYSSNNVTYKITNCAKCYKLFRLTFDDEYIYHEKCIHHPGKSIVSGNGDKFWTCCEKTNDDPGCVTNDQHVWNGVVRGHNEFLDWKGYVTMDSSHLDNQVDGVYAIDCEMCYTREGLEAAKITVVNLNCETVYETYIKPDSEIIDYNSEYSGIYPNTLEGVETTLRDVQNYLQSFINGRTILIGHGLDNDLRALRISHPKCIDTSLLYPHIMPSSRYSLRYLARTYLSRDIEMGIHFTDEDARTAMDLVTHQLHSLHLDELRNA